MFQFDSPRVKDTHRPPSQRLSHSASKHEAVNSSNEKWRFVTDTELAYDLESQCGSENTTSSLDASPRSVKRRGRCHVVGGPKVMITTAMTARENVVMYRGKPVPPSAPRVFTPRVEHEKPREDPSNENDSRISTPKLASESSRRGVSFADERQNKRPPRLQEDNLAKIQSGKQKEFKRLSIAPTSPRVDADAATRSSENPTTATQPSSRISAARRRKSIKPDESNFEDQITLLHRGLSKAIDEMKVEFSFTDEREVEMIDSVLDVIESAHLGGKYAVAHPMRDICLDKEGHPPPPPVLDGTNPVKDITTPFVSRVQTQREKPPRQWSVLDEGTDRRPVKPPLDAGQSVARVEERKSPRPKPKQSTTNFKELFIGRENMIVADTDGLQDSRRSSVASVDGAHSRRRSSFATYSKQFQAKPLSEFKATDHDEGVNAVLPSLTNSLHQLSTLGLM